MTPENIDDFPDFPEIKTRETFQFACGPEQPCFNRCCAQLNLPLTPYDVLRLAHNLAMPSHEFLRAFTTLITDEAVGLPMRQLRMVESPDAPCPFVTPAGCSVYEDRPGACRAYPLGRGAKLDHDGVAERFFIIREDHCAGFHCGPARTPQEWLDNQEMPRYNAVNDRYMRLLAMIRAGSSPIDPKLARMANLCLWQADNFQKFIREMNILAQIQWADDADALLAEDLSGKEAALDFGLDWLELLIFGQSPRLERKQP